MTITEFLLARIAEDEAEAANWSRFEIRDGIPGSYGIKERVLAECEAKRRIVDEHQQTRRDNNYEYVGDPLCITCGQMRPRRFPCATLRALAAVYADHGDYRDELAALTQPRQPPPHAPEQPQRAEVPERSRINAHSW